MLLEFVACSTALALTYLYFRKPKVFKKKNVELTTCIPSWSPINILWLDSLPPFEDNMSVVSDLSDKHNNTVSDETSWGVLPDDHLSSRLREELDNLACSSDPRSDLVSQELDDFSFPPTCGEQRDSKDRTEGL